MPVDVIVPAVVTLACILGVPEILHTCPDTPDVAASEANDCVWGPWTEWSSSCAMTCKGHGRTRTRSVQTPAEDGGLSCLDEDATDTDLCDNQSNDEDKCRTQIKVTDAQSGNAVSGASINAGSNHCGQSGSDGVLRLGNVRVQANIALQVEKQGYDRRDDNLTISDSCPPSVGIPINPTSADGRIVMTWFTNTLRDLDVHMNTQECHISYRRKVCGQNSLDLDNTIGGLAGGPETITMKEYTSASSYAVYVHQYNSFPQFSMCDTGAKIRIYPGNGQTAQTHHVPSNCDSKRYWFVGCFNSGSGLAGFVVKNQMLSVPPTHANC